MVNKEKIKEALDLFENDKFFECREILKEEISQHKNAYISEKLDIENTEEKQEISEDNAE